MALPSQRNESGFGRWVAGALAALCLGSCGDPPPPERIVLIVIDTLRRDFLSCYADAPLPTPHIDALARRGRAYESVSAAYHQTSMSMAALFTGRTPSIERPEGGPPLPWTGQTWCGMARFAAPGEGLCIPTGLTTLAERLRGAGYWTIGVMSNPMLFEPSGFGRGFDDRSEVGRLEDAVVILTSDHGEHLGETHPPDPSRVMRSHQGNPSYQELLHVPLIVAPDSRIRERDLLRTQDLHAEILRIANLSAPSPDLADGELFVGEQRFLTYRRGRFKSSFERRGGREILFDLLEDPREQRDLAGSRPDLLEEHRRQVVELQRRLGGTARGGDTLSDDDRSRLDALGYLE